MAGRAHREGADVRRTFVFCEVKKLSRQMTSWPWSTRRRQRWDPRKPQPPVTRMRRYGSSADILPLAMWEWGAV
eukprot:scaffold16827_cov32-Tisochrysis_lutea.AAC.6